MVRTFSPNPAGSCQSPSNFQVTHVLLPEHWLRAAHGKSHLLGFSFYPAAAPSRTFLLVFLHLVPTSSCHWSLGSVLALPFFSLLHVSVCHHHSPGGSVGKLESYLSPLFSSHSISLSSTSPACRAQPKVDPPPCTAPPRSPLISLWLSDSSRLPTILPASSATSCTIGAPQSRERKLSKHKPELAQMLQWLPPLAEQNPSSHHSRQGLIGSAPPPLTPFQPRPCPFPLPEISFPHLRFCKVSSFTSFRF